ncbi:MAG TPA: CAP domain-containing protein [Pirellulales bacterium]|nr:CAP domain-containing protein [Pirellulales bacterium]
MLIESLMVVAAIGFAEEGTQAVPADNPKQVALYPVEKEILRHTNAQRKRYGLPPLVIDAKLVETARKHAFWMASAHSLQHAHGAWAENIAQGQTSASHAVTCWMNSSGHRANILNRRHRRIGIAGYKSARGDIFWCQQFLD